MIILQWPLGAGKTAVAIAFRNRVFALVIILAFCHSQKRAFYIQDFLPYSINITYQGIIGG
jgi:superfamily II DNA or RNA helicase